MSGAPVLIFGATGSFGGAMTRELLKRGRTVRAFVRDVEGARASLGKQRGLEFIEGDVQDREAAVSAAAGCESVVHGVNYPYEKWHPYMETATENVIAAAVASRRLVRAQRAAGAAPEGAEPSRALVIFPGNVYGLGAQVSKPLEEDAVNAPNSRKGALRVGLEQALRSAVKQGRIRVLIMRAGDYFGPTVRNGLVDRIFQDALEGKPMSAIGRLDVPHQWAYVPDLARASVDLMAKADALAPYEIVHFPGYVVESQRSFLEMVASEAGHAGIPARSISWFAIRMMGTVNRALREVLELRYLFDKSVILSSRRLPLLLPKFEPTPLRDAIRETLASYRG